jgi:hypothetical protein
VFPNLDFGEMGDVDLKQKYEDRHQITFNQKLECLQSNILMVEKSKNYAGNLESELASAETK